MTGTRVVVNFMSIECYVSIGADPCIQNNKGCRIIHTYRSHVCRLVKGQRSAPSGIWNAGKIADMRLINNAKRSVWRMS